MERSERQIRVTRLRDQGTEHDLRRATPEQCVGMMWQLALDAWAMMGDPDIESRLPRHVVRVVRRGR